MRKIGDLMKELGFREDASDDVKIAFIKNLARSAYGVELPSPQKAKKKPEAKASPVGEQLSFSFENESPHDPVRGLFPRRRSG